TVEQLEQSVAAAHGWRDGRVARELSNLELTERLSGVMLARLSAELPGPESRTSLLLLTDTSEFPAAPAEGPIAPLPNLPQQRQIIALAASYARRTISKLPDFFATQETIRFQDTPINTQNAPRVLYQPL